MRHLYIPLLALLSPLSSLAVGLGLEPLRSFDEPNIPAMLTQLDNMLDSTDYYRLSKEHRIDQLGKMIESNRQVERSQSLNMLLYSELAKYDSDAAFNLVNENMERCQREGHSDDYALWGINKAYLFSASGLLKESSDILERIRPTISSRTVLLEYYRQMEYLSSHLRQYTLGDKRVSPLYLERREAYTDSISMVIRPTDHYYLVNMGWNNWLKNQSDTLKHYLPQLEERISGEGESDFERAIDAYTVAHIYYLDDNIEKFTEYLIISAMADTRSCNHDIASFQELATIMIERDDIERAYNYLSYALERAKSFGDRIRVMEIATLMDNTYGRLLAKNRAQSTNLALFSVLLAISLCVVALLLYNWVLKNRKLRKTLHDLDEANTKLDQHVEKLEQTNGQLFAAYDDLKVLNDSLVESNYIKENYIGNTFEVCSTHIGKMEKIFVKISNLVRNNKLEELRRYCDSSLLLNAELKVLYQAFDYTFLKMYPTFIEQVNTLLLPDKQIKLRADETLNTELRILALNRLGISDNHKIASILHCSAQTIYNNYQKSKNRTELSSKELLSEIMKIG